MQDPNSTVCTSPCASSHQTAAAPAQHTTADCPTNTIRFGYASGRYQGIPDSVQSHVANCKTCQTEIASFYN